MVPQEHTLVDPIPIRPAGTVDTASAVFEALIIKHRIHYLGLGLSDSVSGLSIGSYFCFRPSSQPSCQVLPLREAAGEVLQAGVNRLKSLTITERKTRYMTEGRYECNLSLARISECSSSILSMKMQPEQQKLHILMYEAVDSSQ